MDASLQNLNQGIRSSYKLPQAAQDMKGSNETGKEAEIPGDTFERAKEQDRSLPARGTKGKAAAADAEKPAPEKEYTILAYMDGSNNLEECILDDVKEMESCPQGKNYNLAVQFSRYSTSPLTTAFLGEALSQGFQSKEFTNILKQIVGNGEIADNYRELMKDSGICQKMASVLLKRNPRLQERLDKLVLAKVRETAGENKTMAQVIGETAGNLLGQIVQNEQELLAMQQEQQEQNSASTMGLGTDLLDIMGEGQEKPLMADLMKATCDFIKGTEGMTAPEVLANLPAPGSNGAVRDKGSLLFVDSGDKKINLADLSGYLKHVDSVEKNNEPLWRGVRRYQIEHSDDPTKINSKTLASLGYESMSKVDTLANFIAWGMKKYPAKHYIVSLSDHGAGFLGAEEDRGDMLSLPQLEEAARKAEEMTGKKPDIIAFDCCLMAQTEVAYELKDRARYMIASEEVVGGDGFPYKNILPRIDEALDKGKTSPRDIAKIFVEEGEKYNENSTTTLSAVDLKAVGKVVDAADALAGHILGGKASMEAVSESLKATQHYSISSKMTPYDDFRDLWDLADKLEKNPAITSRLIKQDIKALKAAVEKMVVKEEHINDEDYEGSHGVSIYAPRRQKNMSVRLMGEYEKTAMAKDAPQWTEFIKKATDYDELLKEADGSAPKLTFVSLPERS